jgi:folate-dependent phosphoribosylglycinamide formyltransferase PurN
MRSIDIIVLYNGSTLSRIYLSLLKKNNIKPKKILSLNYVGGGRRYKIALNFLGNTLASFILKFYVRYKNRQSRNHQKISEKILNIFQLSHKDLRDENVLNSDYYDEIQLTNVNDPALTNYLRNQDIKIVLFTGGWILNKSILEDSGCKFIHIHPGIVPEIKGSDCFFWSYLLTGRLGYSCFYMKPEIDTGDILHKNIYIFDIDKNIFKNISDEDFYKLITLYYDPCLRILTFVDLLNKLERINIKNSYAENLQAMTPVRQNPEDGRTYYFMHPKLRSKVIKLMLDKKRSLC